MNKAIGTRTKDNNRFEKTKEEQNAYKNEQYRSIRGRQLDRLTTLYEAYSREKSPENETDLLQFVMSALTKKARIVFARVMKEDTKQAYEAGESLASKKLEYIWKKLSEDYFESAGHLQATMSDFCKQLWGEALEHLEPKAEQIKTVRFRVKRDPENSEDGYFADFELTPKHRPHLIVTLSSDPSWEKEESMRLKMRSKTATIHVYPSPATCSLTRENTLFLPFLSPEHAETFETLRDFEGDRSEAAICLGLTEDGMNQRIHRMSERYQDMRELRFAFRQPAEHLDDLTDRLIDFTKRLQTLTKAEFPKTLAIAVAQCAEDLPVPDAPLLYDPYEVMNHLLRIWRQHRPASQ